MFSLVIIFWQEDILFPALFSNENLNLIEIMSSVFYITFSSVINDVMVPLSLCTPLKEQDEK